jgi:hypothetical protein
MQKTIVRMLNSAGYFKGPIYLIEDMRGGCPYCGGGLFPHSASFSFSCSGCLTSFGVCGFGGDLDVIVRRVDRVWPLSFKSRDDARYGLSYLEALGRGLYEALSLSGAVFWWEYSQRG